MKQRRKRRTADELKAALSRARTKRAKALAHFRLAVFHDNNGWETNAIPHYRKAIRLGLPRAARAQAFAWLASSLYKIGSPRAALADLKRASKLTDDGRLQRFLLGLERRILKLGKRNA